MAFNFLKKDAGEAPPDVGKEDEYEERKRKENKKKVSDSEKKRDELGKKGEELISQIENKKNPAKTPAGSSISNEKTSFEFEKINAKIEAMNSLMKGFNERFSNVNQQVGEIRAMTLNNEKAILKSNQDALKAVDIVKEVQPEKLRLDFQRLEMKINSLDERLTSNKQYAESLMEEFKEIKRKAGIFDGGVAILKLNEDVKKDLVELQKMGAKVRLNTDKSEQIFIELKKNFEEEERLNKIIDNLDNSYSGLQKEIEGLKLDYSRIVYADDFENLKRNMNSKFDFIDNAVNEFDELKDNNERMMQLAEKTILISKKNHEDIDDIAMTIGDDKIKRVSEYEDELNSILKIIDSLAGQISAIKKKIGIDDRKISVNHDRKKIMDKNNITFKNIEVSPKVSKPLIARRKNTIENVKKTNEELEKKSIDRIKNFNEIKKI
ncbi:hypothetical protein J4429_03660 [Candidatus Pacearchaeota archaeon]|nr:hypothetical protein [Candidatus Pacearchaeota archaeon]